MRFLIDECLQRFNDELRKRMKESRQRLAG